MSNLLPPFEDAHDVIVPIHEAPCEFGYSIDLAGGSVQVTLEEGKQMRDSLEIAKRQLEQKLAEIKVDLEAVTRASVIVLD